MSNQILWCLRDYFSNQIYDQRVTEKWNNWYSNIEFQSFERAYKGHFERGPRPGPKFENNGSDSEAHGLAKVRRRYGGTGEGQDSGDE